jgi:hypothetical protein
MRSLVLALVLSSVFLAIQADAQESTCTPFQLVGFTSATFDGAFIRRWPSE